MKKYYLDNEYNDCECADTRIYSSRVPAEKPFESKPRKKPKCATTGTHHHAENRKKKKKHHTDEKQHSVPQTQLPMQVLYHPVYCPNLPTDYQRKNQYKNISNECSADCMMYQNSLPTNCILQHPKGVYTSPCRMQYPSTSTEDNTYSHERGVLNAQYPCPCMPIPVECTKDYMRPFPFFHTMDCNECPYPVDNQQKDSRSSAGKRAWCYIKRKTKRMVDNKNKRKEARQRKRQKRLARQHEMNRCYSPPYVYPYPVQVAPYFTCAGNMEKTDQATHTHVSKQTEAIPESDCMESEAIDETTTEEIAPPSSPPRRHPPPSPPIHQAQDESCCCYCDLEMCPCQCCHGEMGCEVRNTQTSCQNIRENCTQTDFPKRCCRCCRCCAKKARGIPCVKQTHASENEENPPKSPPRSKSPPPNRDPRCNRCSNMNNVYYINPSPGCCGKNNQRDKSKERKEKKKESKKSKKPTVKTQMVRTNSSQCIPELENKATSCSCDHDFSCSRMNHFFQHLYGQNFDVRPNPVPTPSVGPMFSSPWTTCDLNTLTCAKLKNMFAGDTFSSPLSGRNYNLSLGDVRSVPRVIETKLPKPLDVGEDILKTTSHPMCYDTEHNKLMSAVCEAILKKSDESVNDKFPIGSSDFVVMNDLCSNTSLRETNPSTERDQKDLLEKYRERINCLDQRISKLACSTDPFRNKQDKREKITNTRHSSLSRMLPKIEHRTDNNNEPLENISEHIEKCIANRRHIDNLLKQLGNLYDRNKGDTTKCDLHNVLEEKAVGEKSNRPDHYMTETTEPDRNLDRFLAKTCFNLPEDIYGKPSSSQNPTGNNIQLDLNQINLNKIDLNQFTKLDFSSITFQKFDVMMASQNASEYFQEKKLREKNFILNNLPSFSSNISNAYGVKALLEEYKGVAEANDNNQSMSFGHSCVLQTDLHSKNKVQPVSVDVKQKLPLKVRTRDEEPMLAFIRRFEKQRKPPEDGDQVSITEGSLPQLDATCLSDSDAL